MGGSIFLVHCFLKFVACSQGVLLLGISIFCTMIFYRGAALNLAWPCKYHCYRLWYGSTGRWIIADDNIGCPSWLSGLVVLWRSFGE